MKIPQDVLQLCAKRAVTLVFVCAVVLSLSSCSAVYQKRSFLSDEDPAYKALEAEQAKAFSANPYSVPWNGSRENLRKMRAFLKKNQDQHPAADLGYPVDQTALIERSLSASKRMSTLTTRFENPLAYLVLSNAYQAIQSVDIYNHPTDIRFGTLPTRSIGAETVPFSTVTNHFIIVSDKLFDAIYLLLTAALDAVDIATADNGKVLVTSRVGKDLKETFRLNPDMVTQFELVILYLIDANKLEHFRFSKYPLLSEVFGDGMYFFVMAHEYAHVVEQHVSIDIQPLQLRNTPMGEEGIKTALHSWKQELQADEFALSLMVKHLKEERMSRTFEAVRDAVSGRNGDARGRLQFLECELTSPLLLFRFYQILEEAQYIKEHGELTAEARQSISKDSSFEIIDMFFGSMRAGHPPAELRKGLLMRALDHLRGKPLESSPGQNVMDNFELGWFLERNLGELWEQVRPMISELLKLALKEQSHMQSR